ncbi:MAG TPA: hypothetical protein VF669_02405 [Tepidisphaeraceae bacterium]
MSERHEPFWTRPYFKPSAAQAELFFLVVGPQPGQPLAISRRRHHVAAMPAEVQVSTHARSEDAAWFEGWFAEPLGNEIDPLFLNPEEVRGADHLTIVRGTFEDQPDLDYLRNTIGIVSAIADTPATLAVFDAVAMNWWRPSEWRAAFVDKSEFAIDEHVRVIITDDPNEQPGLWSHTRGMKKFARPDVQLKHIPGPYTAMDPLIRAAGWLIRATANYQAQGMILREDRPMTLGNNALSLVFKVTPDDSETARHFNNAAVEILEYDEATGSATDRSDRLLARAARAREEE